MSERLLTNRELEGVLRRLALLETRVGRVEVTERPYYDTGSWVPTLIGLTTAGTLTYDANNTFAEWTREGNRVLFNGSVHYTAIPVAPVGSIVITGFPFAAATLPIGTQPAGGATLVAFTLNLSAGYTSAAGVFVEGETQLRLVESGDGVAPASVLGAGVVLVGGVGVQRFEGQYRVA